MKAEGRADRRGEKRTDDQGGEERLSERRAKRTGEVRRTPRGAVKGKLK